MSRIKALPVTVRDLVYSRLWLIGFISFLKYAYTYIFLLDPQYFLQAILGAGLFIVAQEMIGPSLTPALGSIGLVVLVFASCVVDEKLTWDEYLSIAVIV